MSGAAAVLPRHRPSAGDAARASRVREEVSERLGRLLAGRGLVEPALLEALRREAGETERPLADVLLDSAMSEPRTILELLGEIHGVPHVDLASTSGDRLSLELVPREAALELEVLPLWAVDRQLTVAMADPSDLARLDALRFVTGMEILPCVALAREVRRCLSEAYGPSDEALSIEGLEIDPDDAPADAETLALDLEDDASGHPIVRLCNLILVRAMQRRASDVHLEPRPGRLQVRYRIDGLLEVQPHQVTSNAASALVSRVKVLARLDISEHRRPQDGGMHVRCGDRHVDVRVSTFPTIHGEKVVLRLLDKQVDGIMDLGQLGFDAALLRRWRALSAHHEGLLLCTGPTGSGKSTTLLATLALLRRAEVNVVTLEDPVEYELEGVNQGQVAEKAGFTFAGGLRSVLRQDPDIILVGEIRDQETARIATQAALTGHLVLSTLHANDSPSAVTRLADIGIRPYLVSATLLAVLSQRLVRRICRDCAFEDAPTEADRLLLEPWLDARTPFLHGRGCARCRGRGHAGRIAIHELLEVSPQVQAALNDGAVGLARAAREEGYRPLWWDGLSKVRRKETSLRELVRVVRPDPTEPRRAPAAPPPARPPSPSGDTR